MRPGSLPAFSDLDQAGCSYSQSGKQALATEHRSEGQGFRFELRMAHPAYGSGGLSGMIEELRMSGMLAS